METAPKRSVYLITGAASGIGAATARLAASLGHRVAVADINAAGARAMVTLHHLNNSRSQRILWLLEELGAPYELKRYQRDAVTRLAPPELAAVHPLGKSPIITDGDIRIAESGARLCHCGTESLQCAAPGPPCNGAASAVPPAFGRHRFAIFVLYQ